MNLWRCQMVSWASGELKHVHREECGEASERNVSAAIRVYSWFTHISALSKVSTLVYICSFHNQKKSKEGGNEIPCCTNLLSIYWACKHVGIVWAQGSPQPASIVESNPWGLNSVPPPHFAPHQPADTASEPLQRWHGGTLVLTSLPCSPVTTNIRHTRARWREHFPFPCSGDISQAVLCREPALAPSPSAAHPLRKSLPLLGQPASLCMGWSLGPVSILWFQRWGCWRKHISFYHHFYQWHFVLSIKWGFFYKTQHLPSE